MRWTAASLLLAMGLASAAQASPLPTAVAGLSAAEAHAEDDLNLDEFIKGVEATYKDVQSLSADFVQVTRSVAMGEEPAQKGKVLLARPQKMRWEFAGADARLFVTDGAQMWIYSPAQQQVHVYKDLGGAAGGTGMESLLTNLDQLDELFEVERLESDATRSSAVLKLVPRSEANFKHLRLVIDKKKYLLEQVTIVDAFDNETELSFAQMKFNVSPGDDQFTFTPPAGVEVISPEGL